MVVRPLPCFLAAALMGGVIMTIAKADRNILADYVSGLSQSQLEAHQAISEARLKNWMWGLLLGVGVAWFVTPRGDNVLTRGCTFAAVVMVVNYFYYMFAPKPGYMIEVLKGHQVNEWLAVKKMMQSNYHIGLLVGALALYFLSLGVM